MIWRLLPVFMAYMNVHWKNWDSISGSNEGSNYEYFKLTIVAGTELLVSLCGTEEEKVFK